MIGDIYIGDFRFVEQHTYSVTSSKALGAAIGGLFSVHGAYTGDRELFETWKADAGSDAICEDKVRYYVYKRLPHEPKTDFIGTQMRGKIATRKLTFDRWLTNAKHENGKNS